MRTIEILALALAAMVGGVTAPAPDGAFDMDAFGDVLILR